MQMDGDESSNIEDRRGQGGFGGGGFGGGFGGGNTTIIEENQSPWGAPPGQGYVDQGTWDTGSGGGAPPDQGYVDNGSLDTGSSGGADQSGFGDNSGGGTDSWDTGGGTDDTTNN
jgi:hypothetical protein